MRWNWWGASEYECVCGFWKGINMHKWKGGKQYWSILNQKQMVKEEAISKSLQAAKCETARKTVPV
jgi:hypothetical protein